MSNQTIGKPDEDLCRSFDTLPKPIRRMLANAPYNYAESDVRQAWRASGLSAQAFADRMVAAFARDVERLASKANIG